MISRSFSLLMLSLGGADMGYILLYPTQKEKEQNGSYGMRHGRLFDHRRYPFWG